MVVKCRAGRSNIASDHFQHAPRVRCGADSHRIRRINSAGNEITTCLQNACELGATPNEVGGSDVALEASDVALLSDDLTKLSHTHRLSKQANAIIKQNLYFAVGIMGVMVLTTIFGNLSLPLGVIGHEGGTLLVVGNGLRLLFKHV